MSQNEDLKTMKLMTKSRKKKLEDFAYQLNFLAGTPDERLSCEPMIKTIDRIKEMLPGINELLDDLASDIDIVIFEMS